MLVSIHTHLEKMLIDLVKTLTRSLVCVNLLFSFSESIGQTRRSEFGNKGKSGPVLYAII